MHTLISKHRHLIWLLFFFWGFLTYANSFNIPFYFDDLNNIQQNPAIQLTSLSLDNIYKAGFESHIPTRPLSNISLALNYYFHQESVAGYHLVNLLIHICTGCLLYILLFQTLTSPALKEKFTHHRLLAFYAAFLWFAHPLHTQSVSYIVQRMTSMSAMFYLLSFVLYIKDRQTAKRSRTTIFLCGSALSGVFAMASKENAATLPFFLFLYEWYFFQDLNSKWLKKRTFFLLATCLIFVIVAVTYLGSNPLEKILSSYNYRDFTLTERILTQFRVIIHYISLTVFPHPSRLNLDYDFPLSFSLFNPISTFFSIIAIGSLFVAAIMLAKKQRLISFCIIWFLGNLVIESSFIGLEIIYEHRTYLPLMFFMIIPLSLAHKVIHKKTTAIIIGCIILVFGLWTFERNRMWSNPVLFWEDCISKSENKPRPYSELGIIYLEHQQPEKAAEYFLQSLQKDSEFADGHNNLAITYAMQGNLVGAEKHFSEAVRLRPFKEAPLLNLGKVLFMLGKVKESVPYLQRSLQQNHHSIEAQFFLGKAYLNLKDKKKAIHHFSSILQQEPDNPVVKTYLNKALKM